MKGLIFLGFVLMLNSSAMAAETYLCIPDMATGFAFDKASQKWHPAQFKVSGEKHLLKRVANGATWNEFGSTLPPIQFQCSDFNEWGSTFCSTPGATITFNEKNLRYQYIYPGSYITHGLPVPPKYSGVEKDWITSMLHTPDTPSIEIGTCSNLSG